MPLSFWQYKEEMKADTKDSFWKGVSLRNEECKGRGEGFLSKSLKFIVIVRYKNILSNISIFPSNM
jgi:hypothetical protein